LQAMRASDLMMWGGMGALVLFFVVVLVLFLFSRRGGREGFQASGHGSLPEGLAAKFGFFSTGLDGGGWEGLTFEQPPGAAAVQAGEPAELGQRVVMGPPSNELGVVADGPYTIVWVCRTRSVGPGRTPLIALHANTAENLAASVSAMRSDMVRPATLEVRVADEPRSLPQRDADPGSPFVLADAQVHCLMLVRDAGRVQLFADDREEPIVQGQVDRGGAGMSNHPLQINASKRWDAQLFAVGVAASALGARERGELNDYLRSAVARRSPEWRAMQARVAELTAASAAGSSVSRCPFPEGSPPCSACESVDWRDPSALVRAPDACRRAVAAFCEADPGHPACGCWTAGSRDSPGCITFRGLVGESPAKTGVTEPPPPPSPTVD
jgi:hypothetical protein